MDVIYEQIRPLEVLLFQAVLFIPRLALGLAVFFLAIWLGRWTFRLIRKALAARKVDHELTLLVARTTQISIVVLGTIWALSIGGFNVTAFIAGLGIAGFIIGFAVKDIIENFVAGVFLLLRQPFDIGDSVEAGGYSGTVTNIEIRSTTIRTWDGLLVIIPNAKIFTSAITNYSKVDKRRVSVDVGVGYETNLPQASDVMLGVVDRLPGIRNDPEPFVVFREFGESSINATLYFWIDTSEAGYWGSLDAVITGIKNEFEREGINIPFPTRRIVTQQPIKQPVA